MTSNRDALQGAALAFSGPVGTATPARSGYRGTNGALAAASFAGIGQTESRNGKQNKEGVPWQARRQAAAANSSLQQKKSPQEWEQSQSQIAAVLAATSSSPLANSLNPARSKSSKTVASQPANSDFPGAPQSSDCTYIAETNSLIKLYEQMECPTKETLPTTPRLVSNPAVPIAGAIPSRRSSGNLSLQGLESARQLKPQWGKHGSTPNKISSTGNIVGGANAPHRPSISRSQTSLRSESLRLNTTLPRKDPNLSALAESNANALTQAAQEPSRSLSGSCYTSTVGKEEIVDTLRPPRTASQRSMSSIQPKQLIKERPAYESSQRRASYDCSERPLCRSLSRKATFSTNSLAPQLTADSLANAMVASSLASSRAPSPTKPSLPPPRRYGKPHGFFHRNQSSNEVTRTPSPAKQMRQTLRVSKQSEDEGDYYTKRHSHFINKHPNKHHEGDRKRWRDTVSETERKRYEGLWAANKNVLLRSDDRSRNTVCNIIVRDIWRRSRLPDEVLEEVWELVDTERVGELSKEEFVVGVWLIDQRLKGRKLPVRVRESVWGSVRILSGIKVPKRRRR